MSDQDVSTPHYVTLTRPPPLPRHSGHSLVGLSPPMSLFLCAVLPDPMTRRGAAQSQGAWGPSGQARGWCPQRGLTRRGSLRGREEAPRAGPHEVTWVQSRDEQTSPVPALGPERATDCCGGAPRETHGGGQWAACPQGACSVADRDCAPAPASPRLVSPRLPSPPCSGVCVRKSEWVRLDAGWQAQEEGQAETPAGKGGLKPCSAGVSCPLRASTPTVDRGWG